MSEVVLCKPVSNGEKKCGLAACLFGCNVPLSLVILTTESVDFCKTSSKAVEHHWALLTGQSLSASFGAFRRISAASLISSGSLLPSLLKQHQPASKLGCWNAGLRC